jgi:hypothetical protein
MRDSSKKPVIDIINHFLSLVPFFLAVSIYPRVNFLLVNYDYALQSKMAGVLRSDGAAALARKKEEEEKVSNGGLVGASNPAAIILRILQSRLSLDI